MTDRDGLGWARLVITTALLAGSVPAATAQDAAADRSAAEQILADAVENGFAGQVLVVVGGDIVLNEAYGLADTESGVPIDTSTVFAIGSVTKAFTRAAILKLAEAGRLSLSDPISRYLEGVPADKREITIDQLVTMRAGFGEYHDDTGDHQAMTREEALQRILAQRLRFEPGTDEAYSNSGYTLLAAIVENVSGRPYPEYVRSELMEPAGMASSGFHGEDRWDDAQVARGRGGRVYGDNAPHHWPFPTWVLTGAGGIVASAEDLLAWIHAVRRGDVLGPQALARFYPADDPHRVYAGGDDFGFLTVVMEVDQGDDIAIINSNTGFRSMALAANLVEALRGEPVPFSVPGAGGEDERATAGGTERETTGGGIPDSPRGRKAMALVEALRDGSPEALETLVTEHFAPELRDGFPMSQHMELLGRLSEQVRSAADINVGPRDEFSLQIRLSDASGGASVFLVELADTPPHGIVGITQQ